MNDVPNARVLLRIADMYDRLFEAFLNVEDDVALRLARVFVLTPSSRLTALLAEQNKKRLRLIMYAIDNQQHTITTTETKTGTDIAAYGVRL